MAYPFTEIARAETVPRCRALAAAGRAWHIHALAPDCRFNPRPGQHCFVIEDTDAGETWCAFSARPFRDECHELVQLLHGAAILDAGARPADFAAPPILEAVRDCVGRGEAWHHHVMKPGCVLSPAPGQHVITLERASSPQIGTLCSDSPLDDLQREIELLYFEATRAAE